MGRARYATLNREQTAVERISSQTYALSSERPLCGHVRHELLPENIASLEVIVGAKIKLEMRPERLELPTACSEDKCSVQLSYGRNLIRL